MSTSKPKRTIPAEDYCPAPGYLMLKPEYEDAISEGGIHIPNPKLLNEGEVLKVGPDVPDFYKPGMFIVFDPSSEHELELEKGVRVLVVHINNVTMFRHPQKPLFQ